MRPDLVRRTTTARIPTVEGTFHLSHYVDSRDGKEHLALVMGDVQDQSQVLVRVHSECFTGDVLGSQRCDCGEQLQQAMMTIALEGKGVVIYLRQEGRGIGLEQKLKAYNLQDQGYDTVDANLMLGHQADEREYSAAAAIINDLGITSIRLMTNNPAKMDHLRQLGVRIDERCPLASTVTQDNAAYLATKIQRMRHLLTLPHYTNGNTNGHVDILAADREPASDNDRIAQQLSLLRQSAVDHYSRTSMPFVTLTYAQTLDGTIGAVQGGSLKISGPESLLITHRLRAQHDAILVGVGTVLADDPQLTVRLVEGESPQPVIVDSHLRTPLNARIFSNPKAPWIATIDVDSTTAIAFRKRGVRLLQVAATSNNHVDLAALLALLGNSGIRSLMIEGGAQIISSVLQQPLAQYAVITIAPSFRPGIRVNSPQMKNTVATILEPNYTKAGKDLIVWGTLEGSQLPSDASPAPVSSHLNGTEPTYPSAAPHSIYPAV